MRLSLFATVLLLTAAACTKRDPVANGANEVIALPTSANVTAPSPAGEPPRRNTAPATVAIAAPAATIPAALLGRWGLTPADCTSALGDAKGLLIVSPGELRFYESRAVPGENVTGDSTSISGQFHFTGEGQSWTRFEALKANHQKLVRTESNPPASFTYAKC
jgi:hypothetical protein